MRSAGDPTCKQSTPCCERGELTVFLNFTSVQYKHTITILSSDSKVQDVSKALQVHDRRKPMRDDNHCSPLETLFDRLGNLRVHTAINQPHHTVTIMTTHSKSTELVASSMTKTFEPLSKALARQRSCRCP